MNEILSAGAYEPWVQDLVAPAQVVFAFLSVFVFVCVFAVVSVFLFAPFSSVLTLFIHLFSLHFFSLTINSFSDQYWHDPLNLTNFVHGSHYLAIVNNEVEEKESLYK